MSDLPTIEDVVRRHYNDPATPPPEALVHALIERENIMADTLRLAYVNLGGPYPVMVAEVFAEIGIGTPVPEQERAMIRQQFTLLLEELQRQHGAGQ